MSSVAEILRQARLLGVERLDAQLLLGHALERPRAWLLAHEEQTLDAALVQQLAAQLQRRAAGEPLAYVLGQASFRGLTLTVSPAVLIPRPETELLLEWALERARADRAWTPEPASGAAPGAASGAAPASGAASASEPAPAPEPAASLLDLGTGSGALALAFAAEQPGFDVHASDCSAAALAVARSNALRLGLQLQFHEGDWWQALRTSPVQRFLLVVSNPPYIAGHDLHLDALTFEPRGALTPEGDGLASLQRIIDGAPEHLLPGGWLLLEHGHDQGDAVRERLSACGFESASTRADLAGLARCSGARWPGP